MCFDFLHNFRVEHFSFQEQMSKIWSKIYIGLHVKYSFFLTDFNETRIFSTAFQNILKYKISCKSVQSYPICSMRTDRWKDRHDESNRRFPQFGEPAKNWNYIN